MEVKSRPISAVAARQHIANFIKVQQARASVEEGAAPVLTGARVEDDVVFQLELLQQSLDPNAQDDDE